MKPKVTWLSGIYGVSTWILVGLFAFLTTAHVVLAVLYYLDVHDTGVGYVFAWEWPVLLIVLIDGATAWSLWFAYRRCEDRPTLGLVLTSAAAIMAVARAAWMVFVPVLLIVVLAFSLQRFVRSRATGDGIAQPPM